MPRIVAAVVASALVVIVSQTLTALPCVAHRVDPPGVVVVPPSACYNPFMV